MFRRSTQLGAKQWKIAGSVASCLSIALLLVVFAFTAMTANAQSTFGSIVGTVTDASGGVIPGAAVTVTNLATNEKKDIVSDAAGNYRALTLNPGNYKVEVNAASYKRFFQPTVMVQVDASIRLDAQLEVGSAAETVEVTSSAPLLQTESGSVGSQVEGKVVQEMPLNGRNAMNLLALAPGVVPQSSTSGAPAGNAGIHTYVNGWGNYSIGGGIANESANYIDGAPNNMLGGNSPALIMTQDMVQEFKVESNAVSAEYGHFGGGVVNMASKSGGNQWHGSLYEYIRNTILNTNDYISSASNLAKGAFHQNQYGATLSGPIKKDKAFFMFSWENFSQHKASGTTLTVPTKAMRGEDSSFNGVVIDRFLKPGVSSVNPDGNVLTASDCAVVNYWDAGAAALGLHGPSSADAMDGQGFIPTSCIDAAANIMKGYYAYPTMAMNGQGKNYAVQPLTGDDSWQYNGRVDYALSQNQHIFGRYTKWHMQDIGEDDFKGKAGNSIVSDYGATGNESNNIVIGDTVTINSSTIGDFRVSYMRQHFWNYGSAQGSFNKLNGLAAYGNLANQVSYKETPTFAIIGPDTTGPWNIPVGANQVDTFESFAANGSLTRIAGNHTFKAGFESMLRNHGGIGNAPRYAGQSTYLPFVNGNSWASFMMGNFLSDQIQTITNTFSMNWQHGAYLTDTWRVNNKLTINAGIRYELPGGIYEKKDRATVFLPGVVDATATSYASGLQGTLAVANSPLYKSRNLSPAPKNLLGPRVSFAYSLNNAMVLRGGYGLSYVPGDMPTGLMAFNSATSAANTTCMFGKLANPFACVGGTIQKPMGRTDLNPSHLLYNQVLAAPVLASNFPYMQQWNLTLSKQWKGDVLTEVSYAGSKGTSLPNSGVMNGVSGSYTSINQLPYSEFSKGYAALSVKQACSRLGGAVVTVAQCALPFPQYLDVFNTGANFGSQTYHALYLIASKRFSNGGVINANYTFSKTIGDTDQPGFGGGGNMQDFNNPRADRAIASFDVKHRTIINYVMNLPFGKGQKYLNGGGLLNYAVGGWSVNGIVTLQSGFPYSFQYNSPNTNLFYQSNGGNSPWGAGTARPDLLKNCNLKTSGSWYEKFQKSNFFNAACVVPPGTTSASATQNDQQLMLFGNAPRNTDAIRSQFLGNADFSAVKTTSIKEKFNLLFKAEFFNILNHPVFNNAGAMLGDGGYNKLGQTAMANQNRMVQLSLRLNY